MSEERRLVETFEEDYLCDECHEGQMRPTGMALLTNPPSYPHRCNNDLCQHIQYFECHYPRMIYEPKTSRFDEKRDTKS